MSNPPSVLPAPCPPQALRRDNRDLVRVGHVTAPTLERLAASLRGTDYVEFAPDIFHFVGVGNAWVPTADAARPFYTVPLLLFPVGHAPYDDRVLLKAFSTAHSAGKCALVVLQAHHSVDFARAIAAVNPRAVVIAWASMVNSSASYLFTAQLYLHLVAAMRKHGYLSAAHFADAFRDACLHLQVKFQLRDPATATAYDRLPCSGIPVLCAGAAVFAHPPAVRQPAPPSPAPPRTPQSPPLPQQQPLLPAPRSDSGVDSPLAAVFGSASESGSNPRSRHDTASGSGGSSGGGGSESTRPAPGTGLLLLEYLARVLCVSERGAGQHFYLRGGAQDGVQLCLCVQEPNTSVAEAWVDAACVHLLPHPSQRPPAWAAAARHVQLERVGDDEAQPAAGGAGGGAPGLATPARPADGSPGGNCDMRGGAAVVTPRVFLPVPPAGPRRAAAAAAAPADGGRGGAVGAAADKGPAVVSGSMILQVARGTDIGALPSFIEARSGCGLDQRPCPECEAVCSIFWPECECSYVFTTVAGEPQFSRDTYIQHRAEANAERAAKGGGGGGPVDFTRPML